MLKNKKAILPLRVVVIALLLLVTAVIVLAVFKGLISREAEQAHSLIADRDNDGILDVADKCVCHAGVQQYSGCPNSEWLSNYEKAPDKSKFDTDCPKKI